MEALDEYDVVRFLVDVKDPNKIPNHFEFAQRPYLYDIFFEVEKIVEIGGPLPGMGAIRVDDKGKSIEPTGEEDRLNKNSRTVNRTDDEKAGAAGTEGRGSGREVLQDDVRDGANMESDDHSQQKSSDAHSRVEANEVDPNGMIEETQTKGGTAGELMKDIDMGETNAGGTSSQSTPLGEKLGISVSTDEEEESDTLASKEVPQPVTQINRKVVAPNRKVDPTQPLRRCPRLEDKSDKDSMEKAIERTKCKNLEENRGYCMEELEGHLVRKWQSLFENSKLEEMTRCTEFIQMILQQPLQIQSGLSPGNLQED